MEPIAGWVLSFTLPPKDPDGTYHLDATSAARIFSILEYLDQQWTRCGTL